VGEQPSTTKRRVLVADDNVDAASSLGMLLEIMGHEVRVVHNGLEAVTTAEGFRPDVILLDLSMPELNGYDACGRIRAQPQNRSALIVALTGWTLAENRQRSQEMGFDVYLIKPVELAALEKLLLEYPVNRGNNTPAEGGA
jgi:CheY-like chemotaxis protein